ncbi:MAG: sodium-translocating pyrophosphatase [Thermoplasmata archaeon HGW-Thermoplasmata-1]|nr:MAG: sodium-translocating pyrophosphatase [Thermoplasmata archaeon HGW-Thermoplasmata-1]
MIGIYLIAPIAGAIALLCAGLFAWKIKKSDGGTDRMKEISAAIKEGAMAFLSAEYRVLVIFVAAVFLILLGVSFLPNSSMAWQTSIAFLVGAFLSGFAGNIGMRVATMSNNRTARASQESLNRGLRVAFNSGAVMGLTVVGLGILGVFILYVIFRDTNVLFGFGFGASSIALFARVGGGIYTKAADVGADLVGKVEAGIPEDDPRNPAVIADNVGDNVGDVAGMGADLFESYVDSIIATMALGSMAVGAAMSSNGFSWNDPWVLLPLVLAGIGIFGSIIGTTLIRTGKNANIYSAMRNGLFGAAGITAVGAGVATWFMVGTLNPFWALVGGLVAGITIGLATEYYTSEKSRPAQSIAEADQTGPATGIIQGLSVGMLSTAIPVIATCAAMILAYTVADFYGVALAAVGMLSILGISLATDCYGPVADNAAGIAEMANLGKEVRERCEGLDAVGNTTAAMGKGFAIGSAAVTALALIFTYIKVAETFGTKVVLALDDPYVMVGLFIGAMLPFLFSALTMGAVGRAAYKMVNEVRRQFRELKLLEEGNENKPDYASCVAISTKGALREMVTPSLMAIIVPVAVGMTLGMSALGGLLAGATASGFLMAIFLANSGGAWDNAKKYIESGKLGGKGSPAHKAAVVGDTVGDPCKDTSGPSLNILIKLMSIVSLVFVPLFVKFALR